MPSVLGEGEAVLEEPGVTGNSLSHRQQDGDDLKRNDRTTERQRRDQSVQPPDRWVEPENRFFSKIFSKLWKSCMCFKWGLDQSLGPAVGIPHNPQLLPAFDCLTLLLSASRTHRLKIRMGFPTAVGRAWNVHRACVPASGKACLMRNVLASYCTTATMNWHPCRRGCQAVKPRKKIQMDKSLVCQLWRWAPSY